MAEPEFPHGVPHEGLHGASTAGSTGPEAEKTKAEWRGLQGDVENLAGVAAEQGRGLLDAARLQAQDYVERRKGEAAQSVQDLARSLRGSGRDMSDKPHVRAFFDSAADGLEQLGTSIERRSLSDFYGEAESIARRAPVAVAVGTFMVGLLAARFIKSSNAPDDHAPLGGDARDTFRA
ncbi:hypothetical protein [Methylobacterium sp. J-076]|uniref:hypothetical protein n=1 Tax=Methylobacterium sp. J-076 TaxID=2836655 RepID=UPI001FBB7DD6|nr:hypothetical protein [Methylobacterium sp. J-076]MCJ2011444.1 hypothetical protein [Methylobacterium sp. J-076]